jgi:hypothetical protein
VIGHTLRQGTQPSDYLRRARVSRPEREEHRSSLPLNPVGAWSIALLTSLGLWWGLWLAVSSLASAVL